MPQSQSAVQPVYDFGAPAVANAVLGWRVRNKQGGKLRFKMERAATTPDPASDGSTLTFSLQVAPALASGLPGTFVATTAAANLTAVTNETITQQGTYKVYEVLLRPNVDAYVLLKASGGCRAQMIVDCDSPALDLWNTVGGLPNLTEV